MVQIDLIIIIGKILWKSQRVYQYIKRYRSATLKKPIWLWLTQVYYCGALPFLSPTFFGGDEGNVMLHTYQKYEVICSECSLVPGTMMKYFMSSLILNIFEVVGTSYASFHARGNTFCGNTGRLHFAPVLISVNFS